MSAAVFETFSTDLTSMQERIAAALARVAVHQDWRPAPEAWSFRYIAAHLAVTEEECFAVRLNRLVEEDNPQFDYYDHAGRNFDECELLESLAVWKHWRQINLDKVRGLASDDLHRSGSHSVYGELSVIGLLQLMLDHDLEHEAELETLLQQQQIADIQARSVASKW